jgi:hypothetical protein
MIVLPFIEYGSLSDFILGGHVAGIPFVEIVSVVSSSLGVASLCLVI